MPYNPQIANPEDTHEPCGRCDGVGYLLLLDLTDDEIDAIPEDKREPEVTCPHCKGRCVLPSFRSTRNNSVGHP